MLRHAVPYEAILARRSVRRYDRAPLDEQTLAQVREIVDGVRPLVPENRFYAILRDVPPGADLVTLLGAYGRVVNPSYYVVPCVGGQEYPLVDAGYRAEQIAVHLTALGIGSCFVGALGREAEVQALHGLPETSRIGAFLAFGRPSTTLGGEATNRLLSLAAGASRKRSARDIFFDASFENPAIPPQPIAPLIEAARRAPSAVNAQPWRFLWLEESLYAFVTRNNLRYRGAGEHYCFHDGGTAMANVTLAMDALGWDGQWTLLKEGEPHGLTPPAYLHPLAKLLPKHRDQRGEDPPQQ
jgi:nitroreductase